MRVYEYVDRRGRGVYTEWYASRQSREQAALDAKLKTVRKAGESARDGRGELPPNMFRGPVRYGGRFFPNTYKFTVNAGGVAMRPLACEGPIDCENEWTILVPVIEVGNRYPAGVFDEAERRRIEVLNDPLQRRREIKGDDDEET